MKTQVVHMPYKTIEVYKVVLDDGTAAATKYLDREELERLRAQIDEALPKPFDPTA